MKLAINGYGRIGRQVVRAIHDYGLADDFEIVAINGSGDIGVNAHLTRYDTAHGRFDKTVEHDGENIIVDGRPIPFLPRLEPEELDWSRWDVDLVFECTGRLAGGEKAAVHLEKGAKKVLISAPGDDKVDATVVYGVNHEILTPDMKVVSNASCTTNCLAPLAKVLCDGIGIEKGLMTTIHAFTNDQVLTDVRHKDPRRARSAVENLVPTKTGAAKAVGLVIPELAGKMDGFAVRVPTINVSLVDLTFKASRKTDVEEINRICREASEGRMKGVLGYNELPLVSSDFNHTTIPSIFDATLTRVTDGDMVKVIAWYDNEWGFCCQMLNTARAMFGMDFEPVGVAFPSP